MIRIFFISASLSFKDGNSHCQDIYLKRVIMMAVIADNNRALTVLKRYNKNNEMVVPTKTKGTKNCHAKNAFANHTN